MLLSFLAKPRKHYYAVTVATAVCGFATLIGVGCNGRAKDPLSGFGQNRFKGFPIPDSLGNSAEEVQRRLEAPDSKKYFVRFLDKSGTPVEVGDLGLQVENVMRPEKVIGSLRFYVAANASGELSVNMLQPIWDLSVAATRSNLFEVEMSGEFLKIQPQYVLRIDPFQEVVPKGYVHEFLYAQNVTITNIARASSANRGGLTLQNVGLRANASNEVFRALESRFTNAVFASYNVDLDIQLRTSGDVITWDGNPGRTYMVKFPNKPEAVQIREATPESVKIRVLGKIHTLPVTCWVSLTDWLSVQLISYDETTKKLSLKFQQFPNEAIRGTGVRLRWQKSDCDTESASNFRGPEMNAFPSGPRFFVDRSAEIEALRNAWDSQRTRIYWITGPPSGGKVDLVNRFVAVMNRRHWEGADSAFLYSFSALNETNNAGHSVDKFLEKAFIFYGRTNEIIGDRWQLGTQLAEAISKERSLLVLDGLESLQNPPGDANEGAIRDLAISALLRSLSLRGRGMVVATSVMSAPLGDFSDEVQESKIGSLPNEAGIELLRDYGVAGSDEALAKIVSSLRGHPLPISLLGRYIKLAFNGDASKVENLEEVLSENKRDPELEIGDQIVTQVEEWISRGPNGKELIALLNLLAVMREDISPTELVGVLGNPILKRYFPEVQTTSLQSITADLNRLAEIGLVYRSQTGSGAKQQEVRFGIHAMAKWKYLGELRRQPEFWKGMHAAVFSNILANASAKIEKLEDLSPWYRAVYHGTQAGLYEDTFRKVYMDRIQQGSEYFSTKMFGVNASDLEAESAFFERKWDKVRAELTPNDQAEIFNNAAVNLHHLCRFEEAYMAFKSAYQISVETGNHLNAGKTSSNLAAYELKFGLRDEAFAYASNALQHAKDSGLASEKARRYARFADIHAQVGDPRLASEYFTEANRIWTAATNSPFIESIYSFRSAEFELQPLEDIVLGVLGGAPLNQEQQTHLVIGSTNLYTRIERVMADATKTGKGRAQDFGLLQLAKCTALLYCIPALTNQVQRREVLQVAALDLASADEDLKKAGDRTDYVKIYLVRGILAMLQERPDISAATGHWKEGLQICEDLNLRLHALDFLTWQAAAFHDKTSLEKALVGSEKIPYIRRKRSLQRLRTSSDIWSR